MFIGNPPHDGTPGFLARASIEFFAARMPTLLAYSTFDHQGKWIPSPALGTDWGSELKNFYQQAVIAATEWDHRNVALAYMRTVEPKFDRIWIVDTDEFYNEKTFDALKSYLDSEGSKNESCWFIDRIAYWKDCRWKVDPPEPATPVFCIDPAKVPAFQWIRLPIFRKEDAMKLKGIYQHHLSLTRSDDDMRKKWAKFGHAGHLRERWFEEVWNSPDPGSLVDLHPTTPDCWKKLVPVDLSTLPKTVADILPQIDAYLTTPTPCG
jgi:hypothetical protein